MYYVARSDSANKRKLVETTEYAYMFEANSFYSAARNVLEDQEDEESEEKDPVLEDQVDGAKAAQRRQRSEDDRDVEAGDSEPSPGTGGGSASSSSPTSSTPRGAARRTRSASVLGPGFAPHVQG